MTCWPLPSLSHLDHPLFMGSPPPRSGTACTRPSLARRLAHPRHLSTAPHALTALSFPEGFYRGCWPLSGPLPMGCREGWYTCRSKGWVLVLCTTVTLWPVHLLALASVFVLQSVQYTSPPYSVTANGCDRNSCPRSTSMWPEPS